LACAQGIDEPVRRRHRGTSQVLHDRPKAVAQGT
jgi:hypothetical protein